MSAAHMARSGKTQLRDLIGHRFGRLLVVRRAGSDPRSRALWECQCDCGAASTVMSTNLLSGRTKSCGCGRRDPTPHVKHGDSKSAAEYEIWLSMRQRCNDHKNHAWRHYGGRGIRVCGAWQASYETFLADVGRRPSAKHSLDRVDNDRGYEPGNVRWATKREQMRNMSSNLVLAVNGRSLCAAAWAEDLGIKASTICARVRRGWSARRALTEPVHANHGRRGEVPRTQAAAKAGGGA